MLRCYHLTSAPSFPTSASSVVHQHINDEIGGAKELGERKPTNPWSAWQWKGASRNDSAQVGWRGSWLPGIDKLDYAHEPHSQHAAAATEEDAGLCSSLNRRATLTGLFQARGSGRGRNSSTKVEVFASANRSAQTNSRGPTSVAERRSRHSSSEVQFTGNVD